MKPSRIRKAAETEVPIIPPILLNESNLSLMAEVVAATITDVIITILQAEDLSEWPGTGDERGQVELLKMHT